jgi:hypothetical protein
LIQPGVADTAPDTHLPRSGDLARLRAFGPATLIDTRRGPVPAIDVRRGDLLAVPTGGEAEVVWIDHLRLDAAFLRTAQHLKPVLFCEGDFGPAPLRNVVLSPDQYVWDDTAPDGGGFRRAADLSRHPKIFARRDVDVTYVSILCAAPVVVEAEGLWVSLIP